LHGVFVYSGTLARCALSGGAPREVLEGVYEADWTPDGTDLAVSRLTAKGFALELPAGKTLFSTSGWIGQPRVSPAGDRVAFIHHPLSGDDRGDVAVVDRGGKLTVLSRGWSSVQGLAWTPDGREIWFSATREGVLRGLYGVTTAGKERAIAGMAASITLQDISPSGRVLLTRAELPVSLMALAPGEKQERDLEWLDASLVHDISPDGRVIVFSEAGTGAGPNGSVFLRRVDEPSAVRLGEGWAEGLSPDGKSVLAILPVPPTRLVVYPVGPGATRSVEHPGIAEERWAAWLPDGKRVVFAGIESGHAIRIWLQDLSGGMPRPLTPEGIQMREIESPDATISPDGRWVGVRSPAGVFTLYPVEGGEARPVPQLEAAEAPVGWARDASAIFVSPSNEIPARVTRISLSTGERTPFKDLVPNDPAGVLTVEPVVLAPDGIAYAYSYPRYLCQLFLAEGLR
ncbi:MAG TPA: hypothetical protein VFL12_11480, partial [Thermoanaerobaculia bacterium]|nr:hypothetical protein [Thermoanaerobaculia bacterium]